MSPLLRTAHGVAMVPLLRPAPRDELSAACDGCCGRNPCGRRCEAGAMGTEEGPGASRASSPTGDSDDSDVGVATEDSGWGAAAPMRRRARPALRGGGEGVDAVSIGLRVGPRTGSLLCDCLCGGDARQDVGISDAPELDGAVDARRGDSQAARREVDGEDRVEMAPFTCRRRRRPGATPMRETGRVCRRAAEAWPSLGIAGGPALGESGRSGLAVQQCASDRALEQHTCEHGDALAGSYVPEPHALVPRRRRQERGQASLRAALGTAVRWPAWARHACLIRAERGVWKEAQVVDWCAVPAEDAHDPRGVHVDELDLAVLSTDREEGVLGRRRMREIGEWQAGCVRYTGRVVTVRGGPRCAPVPACAGAST
eukprot:scaffold1840_cov120-Isochrysis_galbana.AAC.3